MKRDNNNKKKENKMHKKLMLAALIIGAGLSNVTAHAAEKSHEKSGGDRARECVREVAHAASDCAKGTNKECKQGIDKAINACTKK